MRWRHWLYGAICTLGVLVIGLGPSIALNIWPSLLHGQFLMVFVQSVFVLGAAMSLAAIFVKPWYWAPLLFGLWLFLMSGCVWGALESIALTRGEIASGRQAHIHLVGQWDTQIEKWEGAQTELKAKYKPIDKETAYTPTNHALVETAQEGKKIAEESRDKACKYTTPAASADCRSAIQKVENAQEKLERITQNYELTQRVDQLELDIRAARSQAEKAGTPPPDYFAQATRILSRWTAIDPKDLAEDRDIHLAVLAEVWAGPGPSIVVLFITLAFAQIFGENWREIPVESPKYLESPQPEVKRKPQVKELQPHQGGLDREWGALYLPGIESWLRVVLPTENSPRDRYPPSKAHPHYRAFCESEGYPPASLQAFGRILKNACGLRSAAKAGGVVYYEFNLQPFLIKNELPTVANAS